MEKVERKISGSKLVKKKCHFCSCQDCSEPKCENWEKIPKLEDSVVPQVGDKTKLEVEEPGRCLEQLTKLEFAPVHWPMIPSWCGEEDPVGD